LRQTTPKNPTPQHCGLSVGVTTFHNSPWIALLKICAQRGLILRSPQTASDATRCHNVYMPTIRIPPIQCLLTFEALARLRSVTQTSEELCVTPSAVSHRVKQLEQIIGTKLFGRADFSLTTEGVSYLAHVRDGLSMLQKFPGATTLPGKRKLRLAVTPTFARSILIPRLRHFTEALLRSPLEPWRTWFAARHLDWPEPMEGSQFNDVGLMCDGAAAGMGVALIRLKLAAPWLENGTLVRLGSTDVFAQSVPSPHAHYLCWRTGMMERWECVAFSEWLRNSLV